jgi:hypothetical protein
VFVTRILMDMGEVSSFVPDSMSITLFYHVESFFLSVILIFLLFTVIVTALDPILALCSINPSIINYILPLYKFICKFNLNVCCCCFIKVYWSIFTLLCLVVGYELYYLKYIYCRFDDTIFLYMTLADVK